MTLELVPIAPDYFVSNQAAVRALHFASGSSALGDLRGFARILYPLGVSIPDLSPTTLDELLDLDHLPLPIFVDTGAFSEREFGPDGPRTVAPITDPAWVERSRVMHRIAVRFGRRAYLVAPDCVGDQGETLRRLELFADVLRACRALGARIVLPIQRGELAPEVFDARCAAVLGFDDAIRAIPGNKRATPAAEVRSLVRAVRPRAVHLLGIGPRGARFLELDETIRTFVPDIELSCDSNLLAAHLGRSNGRVGGPRALTRAASDFDRETAIAMVFGAACIVRRVVTQGLLGPAPLYRKLHGFHFVFGPPQGPRAEQLDLF